MATHSSGAFPFGPIGGQAIGEADYGGDAPPSRLGGPVALIALAVAIAQPDPWTYSFFGGAQPYAPRRLPVAITAVSADQPPITKGGPVVIPASIVALAQPDPWVWRLPGAHEGEQPYGARKLNPSIIAVRVDDPPYSNEGQGPVTSEIIALSQPAWQRDPWTYLFHGGWQPYQPSRVMASIAAVTVDPPPFDRRRFEANAELAALNQPTTWPYVFTGGAQPYAQQKRLLGTAGYSTDPPRFDRRRFETNAQLVALNQPTTWPYVFFRGQQPYAFNPPIPGPVTNAPPYDTRAAAQRANAVALNQPTTWPYVFQGGPQPYAPTPLPPLIEGIPVPIPGAGKKYPHTPYLPEPAWDAKPNKPFRPVWDRPTITDTPPAPAVPTGPAPLPPASLFAATPATAAPLDLGALPHFDNLVPPDALGLGQRMQEAQDLSDAETVLRALGLIP